jgi:hypothetical protein
MSVSCTGLLLTKPYTGSHKLPRSERRNTTNRISDPTHSPLHCKYCDLRMSGRSTPGSPETALSHGDDDGDLRPLLTRTASGLSSRGSKKQSKTAPPVDVSASLEGAVLSNSSTTTSPALSPTTRSRRKTSHPPPTTVSDIVDAAATQTNVISSESDSRLTRASSSSRRRTSFTPPKNAFDSAGAQQLSAERQPLHTVSDLATSSSSATKRGDATNSGVAAAGSTDGGVTSTTGNATAVALESTPTVTEASLPADKTALKIVSSDNHEVRVSGCMMLTVDRCDRCMSMMMQWLWARPSRARRRRKAALRCR